MRERKMRVLEEKVEKIKLQMREERKMERRRGTGGKQKEMR